MSDKEEKIIVENFIKKLLSNTKNIDGEFVELVNEHFWELF